MTTSTTTPRLAYTADGSTVSYTFNFEIADSSSIAVYEGSTKKTLTTHYTISFDSGTSGTGSVVFVSAPSDSTVITLVRDTNLARTTDFTQSGAFLADTVNAELDRLSQAVIDATNKIENHALSVAEPHTETATLTIPSASDRASKVLSFDGSGNVTAASVGSGTVTSVGLTTSGNDLTITNTPVTSSGNINIEMANPITINVTGNLTGNVTGDVTGNLTTEGLTINDNNITGSRSNEHIIINPAGTGNIYVSGAQILDVEKIVTDNTTAPSADAQLANKKYVDDQFGSISTTAITSGTTNVTVASTSITGTVSGSTLFTGNAASGFVVSNNAISTDGVTINDNKITASRSNDNLEIATAGSGKIVLDGLSWPSSDGTSNYVLKTDGSGTLSWTENTGSSTGDLTFVGSTITAPSDADLTLALSGTGNIVLDAITIHDNTIGTNSTNANLVLDPAGTGEIQVTANIDLNGKKITGGSTAAPSADGDLANKKFVDDSVAAGIVTSVTNIAQGNSNITVADSGAGTITTAVDGNTEMTVTDDGVVIYGNLEVKGTTTTINTTNTSIEDPILELSRNNSGPSDIDAGIMINRGAANNAAIYWNEGDDVFKAVTTTSAATATGITDTAFADFQVKDLTAASLALTTDLSVANGGTGASSLTDNAVLTGTGTSAITAEGNLTFNGSTLGVTGAITATTDITATGTLANDAISISDNKITTTRSNDDLYISTAGTGDLYLQAGDDVRLSPTDDITLSPGDDLHIATTDSGGDVKFWTDNGSKIHFHGNYAAVWDIVKYDDAVHSWNETGTNDYPDTGDDLWTVNLYGGTGSGHGATGQGGKLLFEAGADWSGSSRSTTFEIQLCQTGSTSLTTPFKIGATGDVVLTGSLTAGTSIENDAIRIIDNTILGLRSNDNITITPSGTGSVAIAKAAITGGTVTGITDITVADGGTGASSLTDNSVLTGTGTSPITAEGNLTFNGSTLGVTGAATISTTLGVTGASTLDGVTITDNTISSNASNANLEINANGSGTVNLENLKVGTSGATVTTILDEDAMGSDSATSLATQQSIKAYVDSKGTTALTGSTNNTITTVTGANAIQGEANLTFDGSTLGVTGAITATTIITATGTIGNDAVSITDNVITTSRSNDNLQIFANGTGFVEIGDFLSTYSTNARTHYGVNQTYNNTSLATADMDSSAERLYANGTYMNLKCVADSDESTSHARFRNPNGVTLDLNGTNLTNTGMWAGPVASWAEVNVVNSAGSSNTGTIGNATLFGGEGYLYGATSNFTNNNFRGVAIDCWVSASSGETIVVDNAYGFDYEGTFAEGSGGTETITSETAFYARFGNGASKYLLNTNTDTAESNVGTLFKYREKISPLTSSSTITVNCANAPIHTVTLAVNTGFVITNLGTGQTVTIICTQDGTGSRTATFGTDGSTAVKFAGGTPALSTAANAIDVITIVNDGSNYLGNIAKAYAA